MQSCTINQINVFVQEGDEETAAKMQDLALAEGALPRHLHMAMFTQSTDRRLLMNRSVRNMNKFVLLGITIHNNLC